MTHDIVRTNIPRSAVAARLMIAAIVTATLTRMVSAHPVEQNIPRQNLMSDSRSTVTRGRSQESKDAQEAANMLAQVQVTYRTIRSLHVVVSWQGDNQGPPSDPMSAVPNRTQAGAPASMVMNMVHLDKGTVPMIWSSLQAAGGGNPPFVVVDGLLLGIFSSPNDNQAVRSSLRSSRECFAAGVRAAGGPADLALLDLVFGSDEKTAAPAWGGSILLNGTPYDQIDLTPKVGDSSHRHIRYLISRRDHMLRQATIRGTSADGHVFTRTEVYSDTQVNAPIAVAHISEGTAGGTTLTESTPGPSGPSVPREGLSINAGQKSEQRSVNIPDAEPTALRDASSVPPAVVQLTPVASENVSIPDKGAARGDCGTVSVLDHKTVERTFRLQNDTAKSVRLIRLHSTCGCTSALLNAEAAIATRLPYDIPPGGIISIRVAVKLDHVSTGSFTKRVSVITAGQASPAAVLDMTGMVTTGVTFNPPTLNFGTVHEGSNPSSVLKVTIDSRLIPASTNGGCPELVCSVPNLVHIMHQVTKNVRFVERTRVSSEAENGDDASKSPGDNLITFAYNVQLDPGAPAGPIIARLKLELLGTATSRQISAIALPAETAVNLAGYISGALKAEPAQLTMSEVYTGETGASPIFLQGAYGLNVQKLKVESATPFLTCELVPVNIGTTSGGIRVKLMVTIGKDAPAGVLESSVSVIGLDGRRLIIPVTAYVHPKGALRPAIGSQGRLR